MSGAYHGSRWDLHTGSDHAPGCFRTAGAPLRQILRSSLVCVNSYAAAHPPCDTPRVRSAAWEGRWTSTTWWMPPRSRAASTSSDHRSSTTGVAAMRTSLNRSPSSGMLTSGFGRTSRTGHGRPADPADHPQRTRFFARRPTAIAPSRHRSCTSPVRCDEIGRRTRWRSGSPCGRTGSCPEPGVCLQLSRVNRHWRSRRG